MKYERKSQVSQHLAESMSFFNMTDLMSENTFKLIVINCAV